MIIYSYSKSYETGEGGNMAEQTQLYGTEEDWEESRNINLFHQDNNSQQVRPFSGFRNFDDLCCGIVSSPFQFFQEEHTNLMHVRSEIPQLIVPEEEKPYAPFLASFGILKNCGTKLGQWNGERVNVPGYDTASSKVGCQAFSTNELIRMAGENFIQSSSSKVDHIPELIHPYATSFSGLSDEEKRDVEVIQLLLASAEKVGQQQFDLASILLNQCDVYSSNKGNPVQRLVYYFSAALRERINQEGGSITSNDSGKMKSVEIKEVSTKPNPVILALHQKVPFCQVSQFTATNVIIENVAYAKKIHIIELEIRNGSQCAIFMQALAGRLECPVEHLKVTAVGITSKTKIEETGKWLMSFAQSMNLSFSFNVVMVADMLDLNKGLFELDADEAIAVYSSCFLYTMIGRQDRLECLMRVLISMKPCVMIVNEIEANHNSPVFVNRFIEALFSYGAYFNCMADCMSHDDQYRYILESIYFGPAIENIVAAEGEERTTRHVKANVWSRFFAQFKVVQKELSMSSLYQATLVSKNFTCGSSCSFDMDGKSLIIGWKGTPVLSVSAWKFPS